jgi:hypothetical protein
MFRLRWEERAMNELAAVWLKSESQRRAAITGATSQIEKLLLDDPIWWSEPHAHGRRIIYVPPLGVTFRIEENGEVISVLGAWLFLEHNGQQ